MNSNRNENILWLLFVTFFIILMSNQQNCFSQGKNSIAEQYYREGIELYRAGKLDSAIIKFRQALKYNRKLSDAYNHLALIYMEQGTIYSRFLAGIELDKALKLDWNNPEYRFNKAMLYLKKNMIGSAMSEFKKVIKLDPDNFRAYYHLGLIKEKDTMRYRDMIDPEEGGIIYFRKFAEKDKLKAVYYFNKAIALNPYFTEVYYRLGLLYYEFDELDDMIKLLEHAIKINPDDKNCHLFLGFAYYQAEKYNLAKKEYNIAIQLMDPYERNIFQSIEMVMSPEQQAEFDSASNYKQKKMRKLFWKSRDPFFLTEFNERELEHYSRIAYANLRYSIPEKNIEGWLTDQGKVFIRYGKPKIMYRTRPEIGGSLNANSITPLTPSKEAWIYPDFQYVFEDQFLSNRYEFAWGITPETDYRSIYERMIKEMPEFYQFVPENKLLEIAADIVEFKGKNKTTALDVNFALPADSIYLVLHNKRWQSRVNQGIFLFNKEWEEVSKSIREYNWTEKLVKRIGREKYFIDQNSINVPPGNYNLALEVHDLESERRCSLRKTIEVGSFNQQELQLSDILLAFNIKTDSIAEKVTRSNVKISPNPLKRFYSAVPIYIYYEIYHLSQTKDGLTSFRIDYTITSRSNKLSPLKNIFKKLGLIKLTGDVTISYEYKGNSPTEYQYQRIDLGKNRIGDLTLIVTVKDLTRNKTVNKRVKFKMVSEK